MRRFIVERSNVVLKKLYANKTAQSIALLSTIAGTGIAAVSLAQKENVLPQSMSHSVVGSVQNSNVNTGTNTGIVGNNGTIINNNSPDRTPRTSRSTPLLKNSSLLDLAEKDAVVCPAVAQYTPLQVLEEKQSPVGLSMVKVQVLAGGCKGLVGWISYESFSLGAG